MSTSFGIARVPANSPVSTQIEQQKTQRDEYQSFTIQKMVGPLERVLRDLYNAAVITGNAKGIKNVAGIFRKIVTRVPNWTDDEVAREFPENMSDIDACIRTTVRAHATVIALTRNKGCKQVIKVPNAQAFFRKILMEVAMDHEPEMFGTKKLSQRNKLRHWIEECIVNHLIGLVPISLFAAGDDEEEEEEVPQEQQAPQEKYAGASCTEESCPIVDKEQVPAEKEVIPEKRSIVEPEEQKEVVAPVKKEVAADVKKGAVADMKKEVTAPVKKEVVADVKKDIEVEEKEEPIQEEEEEEESPQEEEKLGSPVFDEQPDSPATYKGPAKVAKIEEEEDLMV